MKYIILCLGLIACNTATPLTCKEIDFKQKEAMTKQGEAMDRTSKALAQCSEQLIGYAIVIDRAKEQINKCTLMNRLRRGTGYAPRRKSNDTL